VRQNKDGTLISLNYGLISGIALDPIEKKPLYHFNPGSVIMSVGSIGCNLACGFCQNWASVSGDTPSREVSSEHLAQLAVDTKDQGNCGIAFTYTEPLMWYEFVLETAKLFRDKGQATVLVTNGYIQPEPWQKLLEHISAVNIDLKAFGSDFYQEHCGGSLKPVQKAISQAVGKCHVEVTTLLVEGHNTGEHEIGELSAFLADLDPDTPLHLSRYHPAHKWHQPATDPALVHRLAALARKRLNYVYTGNLPDSWMTETRCPGCGHLLVKRGQAVTIDIAQGQCPRCEYTLNIKVSNKE
jgi:pyruvate formate lyase activating enzyme